MANRQTNKSSGGLKDTLRFVAINLIIALVIVVLILIVVKVWLNKYTEHGVEVEVPQITGLTVEEAGILLQGETLRLEVIDSTYSSKVPLGTIVEQSPSPVSKVKRGRTVYVVMNARNRRQVAMPQLVDVPYRQAESTLRQVGLTPAGMVYQPSAYRDLVLDILGEDSVTILPGTLLTENTPVILVVGQGLGTEQVVTPDLRGLGLQDCRSLLLASHLTLGSVTYDVEPTEENKDKYVVYDQQPQAGNRIQEGETVNINLSTDKEKAATVKHSDEGEEEFF
ncbi:MAG: PASTA domain-containing protein [Paludibacteraceae bacterium]|nr:PASTA domain-containing protein [Paludibacteraceae bacterium]